MKKIIFLVILIFVNTSSIFSEEECMICMENKPGTTVFPCRHRVVCQICSLELEKEQNFKKVCIKCKGLIEKIEYDDGKVVKY